MRATTQRHQRDNFESFHGVLSSDRYAQRPSDERGELRT